MQYLQDELTKAKQLLQHMDDFEKLVNAYSLGYAKASHTKHTSEKHMERLIIANAEYTQKENKDCSKEQTPRKL